MLVKLRSTGVAAAIFGAAFGTLPVRGAVALTEPTNLEARAAVDSIDIRSSEGRRSLVVGNDLPGTSSSGSAELDIEGVECDETIQTGEIQTGESGEDIRHLQRSNIRGGKSSQHRHLSSKASKCNSKAASMDPKSSKNNSPTTKAPTSKLTLTSTENSPGLSSATNPTRAPNDPSPKPTSNPTSQSLNRQPPKAPKLNPSILATSNPTNQPSTSDPLPIPNTKSVTTTSHDPHKGFGKVDAFGPEGICSDEYKTLDLSQAYQPLRKPKQVYPDKDGVTRVTMKYEPVHYKGASYDNILRAWNGELPGPTLHLEAGGKMELELINCNREPEGPYGGLFHNDYKAPNITNIHTHGPHISGESPGDFVFLNLGPEEKTTYKYEFDENHFPGTFWYHPHFHGSTALQVGQGAAGMMIIDDNELYPVPDAIKDMEEIQMVVQHMNLATLQDASSTSLDNITYWKTDSPIKNDPFNYTEATTDLTNFMMVNMQFLPVVTMKANKWYRWRMVMSSVKESVAFHPGSEHCEMKLLAKDGIYLDDAPRDISTAILSPGNRADLAVRCNSDSIGLQYMNVSAESADLFAAPNGNFDPDGDQFDPIYEFPDVEDLMGSFSDPKAQPVLLVIKVEPDDLPEFGKDLKKPCYLVDLTDESVDAMFESGGEAEDNKFTNAYGCVAGGRANMPDYKEQVDSGRTPINGLCGVGGPYGVGGDTTVGKTFEEAYNNGGLIPWKDETYYMNDFETGTVQEIRYNGAQGHPYHQHVNSYQIRKIEPTGELKDFVKEYYKVGDWHDVLQFPHNQAVDVTFRFQADQFTGHMVQHCHLLFHEDLGMMTQYDITGKEGATWEYAKVLDPQCVPPMGSKSSKSKSSKTHRE